MQSLDEIKPSGFNFKKNEEFIMENNFKDNIESIFSNFEKFLRTETVIGEPIAIGEVTLVPIISVSFGCGAGSGTGKDKDSVEGNGAGGGGAAWIKPDAVVVIKNGDVSILPIKNKNNFENLLNMVPEIISKVNKPKENEEEENKDNQ